MNTNYNISKTRLIIAVIALFLSSMCTVGDTVVTPIAIVIYGVFDTAPEALINLGVTGPGLVGLPFCILGGVLCDKFDKKKVMVVGFIIFTLSAVFGASIENIYYFVILRCFATGVGWGLTNTAAMAILAALFTDENKHGRIVGGYIAVMGILGALMSLFSGILATASWRNSFKVYLISVPVLILLMIFLPSMPPLLDKDKEVTGEVETKQEVYSKYWWKKLIPLNIQIFLIAICSFIFIFMISLYVADAGIGNEAYTGVVGSVQQICGALGGFAFGFMFKKMKNAVYIPGIFIMAFVFIILGIAPAQALLIVCAALLGFSWNVYFSYFYTRCVELVPESKAGFATGVVALSDGLASALSSYLLIGLMNSLHKNAVQVFPIFGFIILAVSIVSLLSFLISRKKIAR